MCSWPTTFHRQAEVPPPDPLAMIGEWSLAPKNPAVQVRDGRIFTTAPEEHEGELLSLSDDRFVSPDFNHLIEFSRDQDGRATKLEFRRYGERRPLEAQKSATHRDR